VSFRAVPGILRFVNDVFTAMSPSGGRRDAFRYGEADRFPVEPPEGEEVVAFLAGGTVEVAADRVATEIRRLIESRATVRDRQSGLPREVVPADVAILFRSRDSHREYEAALERLGLPTYVYKGLGFFESDEIQDLMAALRVLADPTSAPRAAAFLRSRFVRLSDAAMRALAPSFGAALVAPEPPAVRLDEEDRRVLDRVRSALPAWLARVDRVTPSELLDLIVRDAAYAFEMRGPRSVQARENVKKLRAMIRRIQNRGYATLARIADHLAELAVGDESNAIVDAQDAVNLMTVHAAKGVEFPIVFVVNLGRGTGGPRAPIRVLEDGHGEPSVAIGDFESEADEDAQARDREETKRLLYVALTRARDRLYLSGVLKDGTFRPGRGSLGEVVPRPVVAAIEAAQ
jgi:ATP-dependent helicase/nuclease subunit A